MAEWISECIESQQEVGDALKGLTQKIHKYEDAAQPSYCRESNDTFLSAELELFRPGWKHFTGICILFGIAGVVFASLITSFEAGAWSDLALLVTVPVFVLGVSVAILARSMSESGRFAVEYLNESCRMVLFCCLTLTAVLIPFVGQFMSTVTWFPRIVTAGFCSASLGGAIDCLAMLAFVVRETIRCSVPSKSIGVVSKFAARKLCYGYLKEAYVTLFRSQYKDYLEKWCVGKAIHPPSQYYGHYFKSNLHSDEGIDDCTIELASGILEPDIYKDYDLKGLEELEKYLRENDAELYLSSPDYESEQRTLGILSSKDLRQNKLLRDSVSRMAKEVVRLQKFIFVEENADFWGSHMNALETAFGIAIKNGENEQLKKYLEVPLEPLSVLRNIRGYKIIASTSGNYSWRSYRFVEYYLIALKEILTELRNTPIYGTRRAGELARVVRNSVWEETKKIFEEMDYHTMELFTWLVPQMYKVVQDAKDEAKSLRDMRAQFGGFYEFAVGWLEDRTKKDPEDVDNMRLVLHDGLTKWLLVAIKEKDTDLIEQLCNAGREIVFGREGIKFTHREAVAQHFVLAGRLISMAKAGEVNATAIERMFFEQHSHAHSVDFEELVRFYLDNTFPLNRLDSYLEKFYSPNIVRSNLFTGSSHSSGFGMTGVQEVSWAFTFLAVHALSRCREEPAPNADISGRVTNEHLKFVEEVFKSPHLNHGFKQFKNWLKKCEDLASEQETMEIAEAVFDEKKVAEWKRKFWEGYMRAMPVLAMCLKNGNYEIDNDAKSEWRCDLPKIAVIDWKYPLSGAEGDEYGSLTGQKMEKELVKKMAEHKARESKVEGGMSEVVGEAVSWLEKEGCDNDKGIVIVVSRESPDSELYEDEDFVPSWREDVRSREFERFYKGFPVVWLREEKKKDEVEVTEKVKEPRCDKVVAVDMRGWTGISVREDVISKKKFGDLEIREWKKEEINNAIESGKLDPKEVDKAKGNCPVDVSFFWEFSSEDMPTRKFFSVVHTNMQKEEIV